MPLDPRALLREAQKAEQQAGLCGKHSISRTIINYFMKYFNGDGETLKEIAELYAQAAKAFRISNQSMNLQAGEAFVYAADLQTRAGEVIDAAYNYQNAFEMYREIDPQKAIGYLTIAIDTYALHDESTCRAATKQKIVGDVYVNEQFPDIDKNSTQIKAIEAYTKAANWFKRGSAPMQAYNLHLRVAELAASIGQVMASNGKDVEYQGYIVASENFEVVASASVSNEHLKWSIKDYLLNAGLCRLAQDDLTASKLSEYRTWDPKFASTIEYQFLINCIEAVKSNDLQTFANRQYEYSQKHNLNAWKIDILEKIKSKIEDDDFS